MNIFETAEKEDEFREHVADMKNLFYSREGFYASFTNFLNAVKEKQGVEFVKKFRQALQKFYFAQEIVQIFQPPPLQDALKRKPGYYPKIISFYPFERLYMDTGKIRIYEKTRSAVKEKVDKTGDYDANIKKNGEDKFPEELRWVYPSGIKKSGSKGGNKLPGDLARRRDQFMVDNPDSFSKALIKNASTRLEKNAYN